MNTVSNTSTDTRDLLWTSGWDSTFRLLSALLLEDAHVRPHYVTDPARPSTEAELKAMASIRSAIAEQYPGAAERLMPTQHAHRDEIPTIPMTRRRFASLAARGEIGSQYEWLARYAASVGLVDLELAIHFDDKAHVFLQGHVEPIRYRSTTVYRLTDAAARTDLALFERFSFPVFDVTKRDMQRLAAENGFLDILELSWFCHTPLAGQPCGTCGPCNDAIREGVGYRLPPVGRLRNRVSQVLPLRQIASSAKRLLRPAGGSSDRPVATPGATPAPTGVSLRATAVRPAPQTDGGVH